MYKKKLHLDGSVDKLNAKLLITVYSNRKRENYDAE